MPGSHAAPALQAAGSGASSPRDAGVGSDAADPAEPPGRRALGEPAPAALPISIEPVVGGRSLIVASQTAGEPVTALRRLDAVGEARWGPVVRLTGEHYLAAYDRKDDRYVLVTSDGPRLCVATYRRDAALPEARGCAAHSAAAIADAGDRIALIEAMVEPAPAAPVSAGPRPKVTAKKTKATKKPSSPARSVKKRDRDRKKKAVASSAPPRKPAPKLKVDVRVRWVSGAGVFDADSTSTGLRFERPLEGMTVIDAVGRGVVVDLLWHEWIGDKKVGQSKKVGPLGSSRIAAGTVRADGTFDPTSRTTVAEGDLEYGLLAGHRAPRLMGSGAASAYVGLAVPSGTCEFARVAPSPRALASSSALCALDPHQLASGDAASPGRAAAFERLLAEEPRRAFGQPRNDPGLVVWAGDRGYYLIGENTSSGARPPAQQPANAGDRPDRASSARGMMKLRSTARADGAARDEPWPIIAQRSRIAWGSFAPDGEGVAFAAGALHRVDASGELTNLGPPAGGAGAQRVLTEAAIPGVDRRRASRIGSGWWAVKGGVVRLPDGLIAQGLGDREVGSPSIAGASREAESPDRVEARVHPDTAALVGGRNRGVLIEVRGEHLRVTGIDPAGLSTPMQPLQRSPVRVGLDASERASGSAIVAGVSVSDPKRVVAFTLDESGRAGPARATSLAIVDGELAVRLTPLPGGGALLTTPAQRQVVWLDDDATELAAAAWPASGGSPGANPSPQGAASCVDGLPARALYPAREPGRFVRVPELAVPGSCVMGDVVWAADGTLRWFGSSARGLDARAEIGLVRLQSEGSAIAPTAPISSGAPAPVAPGAPVPISSGVPAPIATGGPAPISSSAPAVSLGAPAAVCPAEMVSIGGLFCVDRFEGTLFADTGEAFSPDFPATPGLLEAALGEWVTGRSRIGDVHARAFPLPHLPFWQRGAKLQHLAATRRGVQPSGYVTGLVAESACLAVGKRLCTADEFMTACRGEDDTLYPYGDDYIDGACNVFREGHPAAVLHGNASIGHLDPRLNRVTLAGQPLLRKTGATPRCRSRWGGDAVYDLVGNVDEWVDEGGGGAFAGGFYSRSTRAGCEALITAHPRQYLDYSTGVRCCRDAARPPAGGAVPARP